MLPYMDVCLCTPNLLLSLGTLINPLTAEGLCIRPNPGLAEFKTSIFDEHRKRIYLIGNDFSKYRVFSFPYMYALIDMCLCLSQTYENRLSVQRVKQAQCSEG